jgi:glycosyltransferase involved in cell wall biosynthesis
MKFPWKRAKTQTDSVRPLRIGIWCDYGFTLTRLGGIGVFVYNLVEGLFALDELIEVVVLVRQGDQHVTDCLQASGRGRLKVVPASLSRWIRLAERMHQAELQLILLKDRLTLIREGFRDGLKRSILSLLKRASQGNVALVGLLVLGLPIAFLLVWIIYALFQVLAALGTILRLPFKIVWDTVNDTIRKVSKVDEPAANSPEGIAKAADCDVWLIPYWGLSHPLPARSVLVLHDLVTSHYPEGLNPILVRNANRMVPARAAEAVICACMSSFIRDNDLLGTLGLSPSRVRMVRFAAPRDFPEVSKDRAQALRPSTLRNPYIFYPSGIRGYKNQRILIEALGVLRDRHHENSIDLVLTGEVQGILPPELQGLVDQSHLQDRIHVLGPVDRDTLGALFHGAFAVIVPSLYEQGSFPIYEGLHFGCPVACSDIPSLREQCAPMGEAMLYFDPRDAAAVAQTIISIRDHRAEIRDRQQHASRLMWQRTWKDAARDWLVVFKEAVQLSQESEVRSQKSGTIAHRSPLPALAPWPHQEIQPCLPRQKPEILLFLQTAYLGGVWEASRTLVQNLVRINKDRGQLALTLAIDAEQTGLGKLDVSRDDLAIEEMRIDAITCLEMKGQLGIIPGWPFESGHHFSILRGAMPAALRADAWFALGDRFPRPLFPVRPYGLIVYDILPARFPKVFGPVFSQMVTEGMKPTAQAAQLVLVTSSQTRDDLQKEYGIDAARVRLVPPACEPHTRFHGLVADAVDVPHGPLILNVANAGFHKGADVLLRAIALMKKNSPSSSPKLVICGHSTDTFSVRYTGAVDHPNAPVIRKLVGELGLIEGQDVVFLGFVSDEQLRYLHERCSVIVNAAQYDNGSFSMIEGAYFGQQVISSRYGAAEYLSDRFGAPTKFFPSGDAAALADLLEQAATAKRITGIELEQVRADLASGELGFRRYAERVYECLVELAELGRRKRGIPGSIRPAA